MFLNLLFCFVEVNLHISESPCVFWKCSKILLNLLCFLEVLLNISESPLFSESALKYS